MKRYQGKNAWWFILIFVLYNLLPMGIFMKEQVEFNLLLCLILLFYYLFNFIFIPILIRNYIDLYDEYFIFYYGFQKRKIDIHQIKKMEKTRSMMASSANSLDRIYIETNDGELMVSLKKNDEFIKEISSRLHQI